MDRSAEKFRNIFAHLSPHQTQVRHWKESTLNRGEVPKNFAWLRPSSQTTPKTERHANRRSGREDSDNTLTGSWRHDEHRRPSGRQASCRTRAASTPGRSTERVRTYAHIHQKNFLRLTQGGRVGQIIPHDLAAHNRSTIRARNVGIYAPCRCRHRHRNLLTMCYELNGTDYNWLSQLW